MVAVGLMAEQSHIQDWSMRRSGATIQLCCSLSKVLS